jgi:hypothetical protein
MGQGESVIIVIRIPTNGLANALAQSSIVVLVRKKGLGGGCSVFG